MPCRCRLWPHDFRHYKGKMYRLLGLTPNSKALEPMDDGKS